jgi:erythromycin esterase
MTSVRMRFLLPGLAAIFAATIVHADAPDSSWVDWLRTNHAPVNIVAGQARDDFADLQFLKDVLRDRRVVQIGESHHSVAEYHELKTRLVKFLHQEMGFDVLAFESSVYECFAADLTRLSGREALSATIFGVWATEQMVPLFDYLKASQGTERPLAFAGFDNQISAPGAVTGRPEFFRRVLRAIDAPYAADVARFDAEFIDRIRREGPRYARDNETRLLDFYQQLATFIETNRQALDAAFPGDASPFIAQRTAIAMTVYVRQLRSFLNDPNDATPNGHFEIRDLAMADNITALARERYPDKKIIVWAANLHVRHANHATSYGFHTMGSWLKERFGDELYTIGVYPYRGTFAGGDRSVRSLQPAEGTMEHLLSTAPSAPLFVDLRHQERNDGNQWMFETVMTREPEPIGTAVLSIPIVPREQYDGILFFDTISAPRFLTR